MCQCCTGTKWRFLLWDHVCSVALFADAALTSQTQGGVADAIVPRVGRERAQTHPAEAWDACCPHCRGLSEGKRSELGPAPHLEDGPRHVDGDFRRKILVDGRQLHEFLLRARRRRRLQVTGQTGSQRAKADLQGCQRLLADHAANVSAYRARRTTTTRWLTDETLTTPF